MALTPTTGDIGIDTQVAHISADGVETVLTGLTEIGDYQIQVDTIDATEYRRGHDRFKEYVTGLKDAEAMTFTIKDAPETEATMTLISSLLAGGAEQFKITEDIVGTVGFKIYGIVTSLSKSFSKDGLKVRQFTIKPTGGYEDL